MRTKLSLRGDARTDVRGGRTRCRELFSVHHRSFRYAPPLVGLAPPPVDRLSSARFSGTRANVTANVVLPRRRPARNRPRSTEGTLPCRLLLPNLPPLISKRSSCQN